VDILSGQQILGVAVPGRPDVTLCPDVL
jgi:hypothetical protein